MIGNIIKVILIIVIVGVVAFVVGPCVYYNFIEQPGGLSTNDMPDMEDATHSFRIENTGGLILSSDYEQHGEGVGARIFILHGFWEMRGNKFKYVASDVVLDEKVFGKITVKRRTQ